MNTRVLGRTGLQVSEIGFGAWAIGGNAHGNSYGPTDDAESRRALARALDLGCSFVDTADVYGWGHSESLVGEVVGSRDDVVVCTKVGGDFQTVPGRVTLNFAPTYIRSACEQSLRRLRREALDVYLLHNPPPQVVGDPRLYETLEALRDEGKIRSFGVSIHAVQEGLDAISAGRAQVLQVALNLLHREAAAGLLPAARTAGVGIVAREPLANGFLAGRFDGSFRWEHGDIRHTWPAAFVQHRADRVRALRHMERADRTLAQAAILYPLALEGVSTVIPGAKTVGQVEENFGAAAAPPLTPEELAALT
ncbi:MAG: aldo/keto reductase [Candidatus Sericytochromatia bacterium]|nr:aldo/keto reductase [Candidatus Tanganyikabacteria bacterium]